jgi:glucose-6-phosphate 1-dehydrogenase
MSSAKLTDLVEDRLPEGAVGGAQVSGYNDEIGQSDDPSSTETFVAIKGEISNWRWGGVPFYLRTGKRLAGRGSEIVVQFRDVPHDIFPVGKQAARSQPADYPCAAGRRYPAQR